MFEEGVEGKSDLWTEFCVYAVSCSFDDDEFGPFYEFVFDSSSVSDGTGAVVVSPDEEYGIGSLPDFGKSGVL